MEEYKNLIIIILILGNIFFYLDYRIYKNALNTRNKTYKTLWQDYMSIVSNNFALISVNNSLRHKINNLQRKIDYKNKRL